MIPIFFINKYTLSKVDLVERGTLSGTSLLVSHGYRLDNVEVEPHF